VVRGSEEKQKVESRKIEEVAASSRAGTFVPKVRWLLKNLLLQGCILPALVPAAMVSAPRSRIAIPGDVEREEVA